MNGNSFTVSGNLTKDLEIQHGKNSGTAYVRGSIGRSYKTRDDQTKTSFFDFVIFGELAEHASASLHKGDRVLIQANLEQSKWTTEDGQNRQRVELRVEDIGPSLRWAEAVVEKAQRADSDATPEPDQPELVPAGVGASDEEPY
jgi:single-strand DNA-binding protein